MDINETNFLYTLTNIRQRLFRLLNRELSDRGIEGVAPSWGDVLYVLDLKGTTTLQEVANHTIKDKSTISSIINKLEAGGYIVKEKDTTDGRYTNPRAKKLRPALLKISGKMNARLFEGFSEDEKQTLFRLMEKIYRNL